jgi:two-component system LytT family response regulator
MKIRALVVDDELSNRINLKVLIKEYCPEVLVIGEAGNIQVANEMIEHFNPDLVFLDVRMPGGDAFELLEKIPIIRFEIIFITAYDEYALRAFQINAIDYLLKPLDIDKLIEGVKRASEKIMIREENVRLRNMLQNQNRLDEDKRIVLAQADRIDFIPIRSIIRCQSESNYTRFFLIDQQEILVAKTLKYYETALEKLGFIRTHQSHLVNKTFIQAYIKHDGGYLKMKDGTAIPVSQAKREELAFRMSE